MTSLVILNLVGSLLLSLSLNNSKSVFFLSSLSKASLGLAESLTDLIVKACLTARTKLLDKSANEACLLVLGSALNSKAPSFSLPLVSSLGFSVSFKKLTSSSSVLSEKSREVPSLLVVASVVTLLRIAIFAWIISCTVADSGFQPNK